jgi:hypothetical protein
MGAMISGHTALNMVLYIYSIGLFFSGLFGSSDNIASARLKWIAGLIFWFVYPIITETLMNFKAKYFAKSTLKNEHKCLDCIQGEDGLKEIFPIVYHPKYNITFCGLEKVHPFDS